MKQHFNFHPPSTIAIDFSKGTYQVLYTSSMAKLKLVENLNAIQKNRTHCAPTTCKRNRMLIFGGYTLVSAGLWNFKFYGQKLVKYLPKDRYGQLFKSDKELAPGEISEKSDSSLHLKVSIWKSFLLIPFFKGNDFQKN